MGDGVVDPAQRRVARVAGAAFLLALVTAAFNQLYVRAGLVVPGDAAATAGNVVASERLFRLGIASELVAVAASVLLAAALYVLLRPVDERLALLALAWRIAEAAALGIGSLFGLLALQLLGGAEYSAGLEPATLHALVRLFLAAHGGSYVVALVFFGLGSSVFAWLLLRSGYVPRWLAGAGLVASPAVLVGAFLFVLAPAAGSMAWFAPIFFYELVLGFWLLLRV